MEGSTYCKWQLSPETIAVPLVTHVGVKGYRLEKNFKKHHRENPIADFNFAEWIVRKKPQNQQKNKQNIYTAAVTWLVNVYSIVLLSSGLLLSHCFLLPSCTGMDLMTPNFCDSIIASHSFLAEVLVNVKSKIKKNCTTQKWKYQGEI